VRHSEKQLLTTMPTCALSPQCFNNNVERYYFNDTADRHEHVVAARTIFAIVRDSNDFDESTHEVRQLRGLVRTLRYYVQLKLLEPSDFRGTWTRYQRRDFCFSSESSA
jgi:hypothetical protein